jgi:hypothetical protein
MRSKQILIVATLLTLGFGIGRLSAAEPSAPGGNLDSPAPPDSTFSYTLVDIYNRLDAGTAGSQSAFTDPTSGPTAGTGHTLDEIMALAPAEDNTDGAAPGEVLTGRTYWGLRTDGTWGPRTGTAAVGNNVDGPDGAKTFTIPDGLYSGSKQATAQDSDLVAGNVRAGANIFGVAGDSNVVDTSSGDATTEDILSGAIAWVDGIEVIGTYPLAPVPRTGQTQCYTTTSGSETPCPATGYPGQDGEYQKGVAWPNPRFITSTAGIVTDTLTGLIWLKNANCRAFFSGDIWDQNNRLWSDALTAANSLASGYCGLSDGSSAGDWRLPNVRELQSLVHYGFYSPAVPNTMGTGQWSEGDPFTGVQLNYYWSSTTDTGNTSAAWTMYMSYGSVNDFGKTSSTHYVWPVRGGQ